jgi:hypothetical protein
MGGGATFYDALVEIERVGSHGSADDPLSA